MKKLVALLLLVSFNSYAECDWKTGITPGPNKTFIYTEECHIRVGDLVQANKDLLQAIELKNLAIKYSDDRALLWSKTASDQMERLNTITSTEKRNEWIVFGLGCATVIAAGFMTARLIGR